MTQPACSFCNNQVVRGASNNRHERNRTQVRRTVIIISKTLNPISNRDTNAKHKKQDAGCLLSCTTVSIASPTAPRVVFHPFVLFLSSLHRGPIRFWGNGAVSPSPAVWTNLPMLIRTDDRWGFCLDPSLSICALSDDFITPNKKIESQGGNVTLFLVCLL